MSTSKLEVIQDIEQLSESQLQEVADYIKHVLSKKAYECELDTEQRELLDLLNYTIESGRKDFAEKHDFYLYGK